MTITNGAMCSDPTKWTSRQERCFEATAAHAAAATSLQLAYAAYIRTAETMWDAYSAADFSGETFTAAVESGWRLARPSLREFVRSAVLTGNDLEYLGEPAEA